MKYDSFKYIYPPRAENAVPTSELEIYDNGIYLAQPKANGDCMLIFTNGIETHVMNRLKSYFSKTIKLESSFKHLHRSENGQNKWMVLVGEHMIKSKRNFTGKIWNEKLIIFDIIVYNGIQLIGKTFKERVELLDNLYGIRGCDDKFLLKTDIDNVYRVKTFYSNFKSIFDELVQVDMWEGLVFKRSNAPLEGGNSPNKNSSFKIRKLTKNYLY